MALLNICARPSNDLQVIVKVSLVCIFGVSLLFNSTLMNGRLRSQSGHSFHVLLCSAAQAAS